MTNSWWGAKKAVVNKVWPTLLLLLGWSLGHWNCVSHRADNAKDKMIQHFKVKNGRKYPKLAEHYLTKVVVDRRYQLSKQMSSFGWNLVQNCG